MATDFQRYRAQIFQISGFALMSPVGKFVIDLKDTKIEGIGPWYFLCLPIASVLFCFGIILVFKGGEKLEELKEENNEQ